MKAEVSALRAKIAECCELISAAEQLALETAKRLDRMEARLRQMRRDVRTQLQVLDMRTSALETLVTANGDCRQK